MAGANQTPLAEKVNLIASTPRLSSIAILIPYVVIALGIFVFQSAWGALLGYHFVMVMILSFEHQWSLLRPALRIGQLLWVGAAFVLGATGGVVLYFLWPYLKVSADIQDSLARLGLTGANWPFFTLYFCAVNPWLEEIYWRIYLEDPSRYIAGTDIWFAGYHLLLLAKYVSWSWLLLVLLVLVAAAWCWRQFVRVSQGVVTAAVSHFAADLTVLPVIFYYSFVR
jgi:hypothetical protein